MTARGRSTGLSTCTGPRCACGTRRSRAGASPGSTRSPGSTTSRSAAGAARTSCRSAPMPTARRRGGCSPRSPRIRSGGSAKLSIPTARRGGSKASSGPGASARTGGVTHGRHPPGTPPRYSPPRVFRPRKSLGSTRLHARFALRERAHMAPRLLNRHPSSVQGGVAMFRTFSRPAVAAALFSLSLASATPAAAINLFSVQQDAEVGRQAAHDAERQLPMLRDGTTEGYINAIVQRLAAVAPGPRFPYRARVVNAAEINAFALPGGYVYVNRGLIEAVRNEGELAGVLAHEMAHVAQRHGTSQATKAYGAQMGVGLLSGVLGGRNQRLGMGEQIVGSLGLNAPFMK